MEQRQKQNKGILAWFARNHVAANLLMLMIIVSGIITLLSNTVEIFPASSVDVITVEVEYRGATPAEAEEGVCLRIEEAVTGIDGVKRVKSSAYEGRGLILIEVEDFADTREVLDDVKAQVDRIATFPKETEKPVITEITMRYQVISLVLYGDVPERTLKELAENIRDDLTAMPNISQIDMSGVRRYEISIEVPEENLRRHGLTFDEVACAVKASSMDLPGGSVKTQGGEILIRTKGQRYHGDQFETIVVLTKTDGTKVYLGEIATVVDGFEDSDMASYFDGQRAVSLQIFRVGDQNLLDLVDTIKQYIRDNKQNLPKGVSMATWFDRSEYLHSRMALLLKNAKYGLVLVFLILSLFLDLRLAFWTTMGIPISFMGAFWIMPTADTSINMMSLYGFILALGIVVDDAIVVGENIFEYRQRGMNPLEAAVKGVKEMAAPVTMAVLTTMLSFYPLLCIYGVWGKFIRVIPVVVISVLAFSLIEAMLILPAHLSGGTTVGARQRRVGPVGHIQRIVGTGLKWFVNKLFAPFVSFMVRWRYWTLSLGVVILICTIGFVRGGGLKFSLLPPVEGDNIWVSLSMPQGTEVHETRKVVEHIEQAADRVRHHIDADRLNAWKTMATGQKNKIRNSVEGMWSQSQYSEADPMPSIFEHISTSIGEQPFTRGDTGGPPTSSDIGAHAAEINIQLLNGEFRDDAYSSEEIFKMWKKQVGEVPGVSSMTFTYSLFAGADAVYVEMSHYDFDQLLEAVEELKQFLREYEGVFDINDSFEAGKRELKLSLRESGRTLGLTVADLARQVRQGFYGDEVQRIQRGRDDVRVMVRYPEQERTSLADIEKTRIRLPDGTEVPFALVAEVQLGRGFAVIHRADRRRIVSVTAKVDQEIVTGNEVNAELTADLLPTLKTKYPGLIYNFEGEQRDQKDIAQSLGSAAMIALLAIFGLLAVQFRSYMQPLIIMSAIPFGLVGAIAGHVIMGFDLSILSIFGIVALTGIVINDSLIMVDLINRERAEGIELHQVIKDCVIRRFRPILLTTLTTFFGLVPMMLEKSLQAQFLIPMAVSLAYGVLFATVITLILVPSLYMTLEDAKAILHWLFRGKTPYPPTQYKQK